MKQTPAQRARAPDEILRSRKTEKPLEVDFEWYVIIVILFENLKKFHSLFVDYMKHQRTNTGTWNIKYFHPSQDCVASSREHHKEIWHKRWD